MITEATRYHSLYATSEAIEFCQVEECVLSKFRILLRRLGRKRTDLRVKRSFICNHPSSLPPHKNWPVPAELITFHLMRLKPLGLLLAALHLQFFSAFMKQRGCLSVGLFGALYTASKVHHTTGNLNFPSNFFK